MLFNAYGFAIAVFLLSLVSALKYAARIASDATTTCQQISQSISDASVVLSPCISYLSRETWHMFDQLRSGRALLQRYPPLVCKLKPNPSVRA